MKTRRSAPAGRVARCLRLATLLALGLVIASRIHPAMRVTGPRLASLVDRAHEGQDAAYARWRSSPGYVNAIRRVKEAIPRDATYVLLDSELEPAGPAGGFAVRFDLAPRRPVLAEGRSSVAKLVAEFPPEAAPRYLVETRLAGGPEIVEIEAFAPPGGDR
jgi:hypothetical protein